MKSGKRDIVFSLTMVLILASASLSILVVFASNSLYTDVKTPFSSNIIALSKGFGYQIKVNNKILIQQDKIPAVNGDFIFCTQEDAALVAGLVLQKVKEGNNPSVTQDELKKLNIKLNCTHKIENDVK